MTSEILYGAPEALIVVGLLVLMACAGVIASRLGRRGRDAEDALTRAQIASIQAATLGLLSLLLGFTFAMAMSRYEYRKQMVVQESNAIGTASLRAHFLPATQKAQALELFERYVQIRLDAVLRTLQFSPERRVLDDETRQIQSRLWGIASGAAEADPRSVPLGLFVAAMNDLIDVKTKRDIAVANHVPEIVVLFLLGLAVLTVGVLGYGDALAGTRRPYLTAVFSVIVALVVLLIIDLDRPQQGLARVSQTSMTQLLEDLGHDGGR